MSCNYHYDKIISVGRPRNRIPQEVNEALVAFRNILTLKTSLRQRPTQKIARISTFNYRLKKGLGILRHRKAYGANRTTFLWYQNNFGSVKNPLYLARLHGRLSSRVEARLGRFLCFLIYLSVRMHIMNIQRKLKHARTLLCSHFSTSAVLQNVGKMAYRLARARTRSASPHEA